MSRWIALAALVVLASTAHPASADPTGDAHWQKGRKLYDLGKYREAIVEWEAAYEIDPKPSYLFNLAQAYRFLGEHDHAIQLFRHYLDIRPDDPDRANIEAQIVQLEVDKAAKIAADKLAADKAVADKAIADKAAADKAAADKATAELAAKTAALAGENKHVRIAIDVGVSILRLEGLEADRSPALGGRIGVSWIKRLGSFTLDLGGSWQLTTIPYAETRMDRPDRQVSAYFTQLHATAALTHQIAGPFWARVGLGLGLSAFSNLGDGNPVIAEMDSNDDVRQPCARVDTLIGYRYSSTLDFILTVGSFSVSGTNEALDPEIKRVITLEGGWIGVYIKI